MTNAAQATAAVDGEGVPLFAAALLEPGEIIVGMWKPALWYVVLRSARIVIALALIAVVAAATAGSAGLDWTTPIAQIVGTLIIVRIVWVMGDWMSRVYVLTDRRVMRRRGIVNPTIYQVELRRLRRVDVSQSLPARVLGTGTVTFSQKAEGPYDAAWVLVLHPHEVRQLVMDTKARYGR